MMNNNNTLCLQDVRPPTIYQSEISLNDELMITAMKTNYYQCCCVRVFLALNILLRTSSKMCVCEIFLLLKKSIFTFASKFFQTVFWICGV